MNIAGTLSHLPQGQIFNKSRFREAVHKVDPDCSESSINWMLVTMRKQGLLASAGTGKYYIIPNESTIKKNYQYPHSPEYQEIEQSITDSYPLVNFQMWELIQMNDFVNHQIAKNVIFIEVEAMLVDTVYELLHEKYPEKHYTGIDLTPKMIEVAKSKNMAGVELVVGDCENLPFAEESFDVVICCQSFHHYPNVQDFFNSVYRVLRPDGRLILRDMTAESDGARWFMNNIEMPVINRTGHGDVHVYGREEVKNLCDNAGLKLENFEKRGFFRLHAVARKPKD